MKTVHEILDEISPMMGKNKISGFSAFADGEHVGCQMMGYTPDILACFSALIQEMVSNMGEDKTITAVMDGFRRKKVDMDSVILVATFAKFHGVETNEEDEQ